MLADLLSGALNMIGFSWAAGPVSTELEIEMMDWLAQLCGLPDRFLHRSGAGGGGVIQVRPGATSQLGGDRTKAAGSQLGGDRTKAESKLSSKLR